MSATFVDNQAKVVVRTAWDTPLLQYLHKKSGKKFRYLGLPGVDLLDVLLWRDLIDEVVAFEPMRDPVDKLRRNMKLKAIPGMAYHGPFEEVVLRRKDYDGQEYSQNGLITLYNLDFCDEISSKISTADGDRVLWRFDAIRRVLTDQHQEFQMAKGPVTFVMMLTIRNQISCSRAAGLLRDIGFAESERFAEACRRVRPLPQGERFVLGTHSWILKCVVYSALRGYFSAPNLSAIFLPPVLYDGTPVALSPGSQLASPMLHFAVICTFANAERMAPAVLPRKYLTSSSVKVTSSGLAWSTEAGESVATTATPDPVAWIGAHESAFAATAAPGPHKRDAKV